jgi:tetratricopeptide (TPR) repeat protein
MLPGEPDDESLFADSLAGERIGGDGESVEETLSREQRWDELIARLVERAEAATSSDERISSLVRAALVFETKLADREKAFLILQTAFQEDFANEEVGRELARVTTALARWPALIADCRALLPDLPSDGKRVSLLLALARFQERHLHDAAAAEALLSDALSLDPDQPSVLVNLAELAKRRGDYERAAQQLVAAAESERYPAEKVPLHLEAATIYEGRLLDPVRAAEQYQEVLSLDPGNNVAHDALAKMTPAIEEVPPPPPPAPAPQPAAALMADAETAIAAQRWADARALIERALESPIPLGAAAHAEAVVALARTCLAMGEPAAASDALVVELEAHPENRTAREVMIEAVAAMGDHVAEANHRRALLGLLDSDDERFDLMVETAQILRDEGGNNAEALKWFQDALALRPDHHGTLHDTLDLLSTTKQWKQAVQVLERLASLETGKDRARYLVATGNILNYELHALDEAVEFYNRALDEDPEDLKSFERIDKILGAKRAWRDEARNFRRMIKRVGPTPGPEKRQLMLMLWKGLGEICRSRLKDYAAAATAFEVCAQLDPSDVGIQEVLAEIFERQGPAELPRALEKRALVLDQARTGEEVVRQIRALLRIYADRRRNDWMWCACASLVASGVAEPKEREFYEHYASRAFARPRAALSDELWQRVLYHSKQDRRLSNLFATVSTAVALGRAKDVRAAGLDERRRVNLDADTAPVAQLLVYASAILAVPRPSLFLHPEKPGEVEMANVLDKGQLAPALVVGSDVQRARNERELAFIVGRAVALLRPDHLMLPPQVVASPGELKVLLFAVLKLFQPALETKEIDSTALKQYLALLQRTLSPSLLEPLLALVTPLLEQPAALDVSAWATGVEHTVNRAGLLVCGDLLAAGRMISEQARAKGRSPDEALAALIRWNVSPDHLSLREQLGLAMDGEGSGLTPVMGPPPR